VNNLGWGLQMTVLGMGIVFALLAVLWGLLVMVLRFDKDEAPAGEAGEVPEAATETFAAESEVAAAAEAVVARVPQVNGMDADLVAAMMVAVLTHKGVRRHEAAPVMRSYWPGSLLYASRWVASGRARQNRTWHRR
jgi:Na+-transporting methylmalonyl-CoA/oxaloacetate decarboxylase gamma subunit